MITKNINYTIVYLFLFFSFTNYSQEPTQDFNSVIIEKSKEFKIPLFKKTYNYYKQQNWDSTLVFSSKFIKSYSQNTILKNYCHYFRGISFSEKKIFEQAEKEFDLISNHFSHPFLIDLRLGEINLEISNYKEAIKYFKKLTELDPEKKNLFKYNSVIHNLGLCYLHLKKFNRAEKYLIESTYFLEEKKDTLELIGNYGDLATLYYEQYKDDFGHSILQKSL